MGANSLFGQRSFPVPAANSSTLQQFLQLQQRQQQQQENQQQRSPTSQPPRRLTPEPSASSGNPGSNVDVSTFLQHLHQQDQQQQQRQLLQLLAQNSGHLDNQSLMQLVQLHQQEQQQQQQQQQRQQQQQQQLQQLLAGMHGNPPLLGMGGPGNGVGAGVAHSLSDIGSGAAGLGGMHGFGGLGGPGLAGMVRPGGVAGFGTGADNLFGMGAAGLGPSADKLPNSQKAVLEKLLREQQQREHDSQTLFARPGQENGPSSAVAQLLLSREREREARKQQRLTVRREKKSSRERQRRLVLNTLYDELAALLFDDVERESKDRASVLQTAIDFFVEHDGLKVPSHVPGEDELEDDNDDDASVPNGPNLSMEEKIQRCRWKKSKREKQRRHNVNILSERLGSMLVVPEIKDKSNVLTIAIQKIKTKKGMPTSEPAAPARAHTDDGDDDDAY